MERRSLLKALVGGAGFLMLPELAKASQSGLMPWEKPAPIKNANQLTEWLNKNFDCRMGEPTAFMEVKKEDFDKYFIPASLKSMNVEGSDVARMIYATLCFAYKGDNITDAEEKLCYYFQEGFKELIGKEKKQIFWRLEPNFGSDIVYEWGDTYMTHEEIEDSFNKEDIVIPKGVVLDFNTHSYRYVKDKYRLNKLRMRLFMPEVPFDQMVGYKLEGTEPTRI